jgi:uncharacterized membrane protein
LGKDVLRAKGQADVSVFTVEDCGSNGGHRGTVFSAATAQASPVTLRACNRTQQTVLVAASYIPIGGDNWRNKGWTRVDPGSCDNIFETANNTFYLRAEVKGDSSQSWGSDIKQCVEYPGP